MAIGVVSKQASNQRLRGGGVTGRLDEVRFNLASTLFVVELLVASLLRKKVNKSWLEIASERARAANTAICQDLLDSSFLPISFVRSLVRKGQQGRLAGQSAIHLNYMRAHYERTSAMDDDICGPLIENVFRVCSSS